MRGLTDGVMNTGQASPIAVFAQQAVQFGKSRHRRTWWTQGQSRADGRVQHPACNRDDDTVTDLYVHEFAVGAALAIHAAQSSAVQRMQTVEDLYFLPDMGTMNRNWPSVATTGCSPVACVRASVRRR
jgi:hypothetical protein